jgi:hypothetical protein
MVKGTETRQTRLCCRSMGEEKNARRAAKGGSVPSLPCMQGWYVPPLGKRHYDQPHLQDRQKNANMAAGWSGPNEAAGVGK